MQTISIFINKEKKSVKKGLMLIQACEELGIQLPRFCYHEQLSIAGNCRMCLVEVEKSNKPIAACAIGVEDGMSFYTNTSLVRKARKGVMEFLLINHPLDCPICDQGGECDLQDQAMLFGYDRGRFYEIKRAVSELECGPFIKTVMTRCIHCTRCVRFLTELGGGNYFGTTGRGIKTEIGTYIKKLITSEISGNIIDLCPVGALTSKPYAFTARPWELKKIETIDTLDSMCSNISYSIYGGKIMRVLPIEHMGINEEWIDDKTRFTYDGYNIQRLITPLENDNQILIKKNWNSVVETSILKIKNELNFTVGEALSLETIYTLKKLINLFKKTGIYIKNSLVKRNVDFRQNYTFNTNYSKLNNMDVCLILGCNLKKEMPLLLLRLRKEKQNKKFSIGILGGNEQYGLNEIHLGNSILNLINIIEGKHKFCVHLKQASKIIVIVGNSILNSVHCNFVLENLKLLKNVEINCVENGAGMTGVYELGLENLNWKKKYITNILNIGNEQIQLLGIKNGIYFGSHGTNALLTYNTILPVVANIETNSLFINGEGRVQINKLVQIPPKEAKVDWQILNVFYDLLFNNKNDKLSDLIDIRKNLSYKYNLTLNLVKYTTTVAKKSKKYFKVTNTLIIPYRTCFLEANLITKNSRIYAKRAKIQNYNIK